MRFVRSDPSRKLQTSLTLRSIAVRRSELPSGQRRGAAGRCLSWVREAMDIVVALEMSCVTVANWISDAARGAMSSLPERIIEHAEALPAATPMCGVLGR